MNFSPDKISKHHAFLSEQKSRGFQISHSPMISMKLRLVKEPDPDMQWNIQVQKVAWNH